MKKIVLFSDGTGNSSSSPLKTNVWRAYEALDTSPASKQTAFYDNGVGTSSFKPTAILGLAFGWGLARNVRQMYGFLCRTYKPGDEIYGFGFSRGAFTMRVAVALIASQGIVNPDDADDERDLDRLIAAAYRRFRQENFTPSFLSFFLRPLRDLIVTLRDRISGREPYDPEKNARYAHTADEAPLIKFVGVWDTVDAYGLPIDELTRAWDKVVWPLTAKDRDLSPRVARACHALALDEQRESFEPMLWNENGDPRVTQVWFAGVHSNVGGSYPDDGLALVALNWMLDESEKSGLSYLSRERERLRDQADANGPLYDSRGGAANLYRYAPRHVERLCKESKPGLANWLKGLARSDGAIRNEVSISRPKIHHSVFERLRHGGGAYAPINLPADYAVVDADGNVVEASATEPVAETTQQRDAEQNAPLPTFPELPDEASVRRGNQALVWNKVLGRKVLYYLTLITVLGFLSYPYLVEPRAAGELGTLAAFLEPLLGTLSFVVRAIPSLIGKIPGLGFAENWAARYENFPFVFTIGILAIIGLLAWSRAVNGAINAEMRRNWRHVTGVGAPPGGGGPFRTRLAAFVDGPAYARWIARPIRIGLEALAVLFLLGIVTGLGSHVVFAIVDGSGGVCGPAGEPNLDFDPTDPCFATGQSMKRGVKYAIELRVSSDWADKNIPADANGWLSAPAYMHLFTPLRRHLFAAWYQPIARIDDKLFDRYPLHATHPPANPEDEQRTLCMEFVARRSGQLYLYVNDAVFLSPGLVKAFYDNNRGEAGIKVTPLPTTASTHCATSDLADSPNRLHYSPPR